jgi:nucleoside-diphosphate-sugar epimerase
MKHVLITGARGFFGHSLVSHFLETTDWVLVCPTRGPKTPDRLLELGNSDRILYNFDGPIDVIIHAAADPNVLSCINNPNGAVDSNIIETLKILEYARTQKLEHFIFVSSTGVYNNIENGTNSSFCKALNMYAATKLAGEQMCMAYLNSYNVPCSVVRLSDMFGPRSQPERFPTVAIRKLITGEKFVLHGKDGIIGRRNWCSTSDASDMILYIINNLKPGDIYNVSGDRSLTHLEFVEMISKILCIEFKYEILEDTIQGKILNCNAPPSVPGWTSNKTFEEGLRYFVEWTIENKNWLN